MKNIIVVVGGAGFIGTNLIKKFLKETNLNIISIDNYSSGSIQNQISSKRVKYIKGESKNIFKILDKNFKKIKTVFHFGEFSRIYQSFFYYSKCLESNIEGSHSVFNFCMKNDIKLIYSATSANLGNSGYDKNLSPYAFSKSVNIELLENLKKWFNFKFEIIYFYNVYGPNQISKGFMSTVIGVFENYYKKRKALPVVLPGTQTRRFTHVNDVIDTCFYAWKKNKNRHYSIASKSSFKIIEVAKMFSKKIKYLPSRKGERYTSTLPKFNLSNKIYQKFGTTSLKKYISEFKLCN
jgi:UDP-glucose 4-epimerase